MTNESLPRSEQSELLKELELLARRFASTGRTEEAARARLLAERIQETDSNSAAEYAQQE